MSLAAAAPATESRAAPRWPAHRQRAFVFWAALAALLLSFCTVSIMTLVELRNDTWQRAANGARNLALAQSLEISRRFQIYDSVLRSIAQSAGDDAFTQIDWISQQAVLFDGALVDSALADIIVADASGRVRWSRRGGVDQEINIADTPYFQAQRAAIRNGLLISRPLVIHGRSPNMVVAISRGLETRDGAFDGLVTALVRLDLFERIMSGATLGPNDVVNLVSDDGIFLARSPSLPGIVGRDVSSLPDAALFLSAPPGGFTSRSPIDHVQRIFSAVHLRDMPLLLSVGVSEDDIFAPWNRRAQTIGLVLCLLAGMTLFLAFQIRREFRRRIETENTLRSSEEQYRLLADHSTDLIIRLDAGMNRRYVSPAALRFLGYEPDEMLDQNARTLIHPDDWPIVLRIADNARQAVGGTEDCYRLRRRDGSYIWVEGRYSYVPSDGGFIAVLRDITKRRSVEEKLAMAHAELTALVNTDPLTGLSNRRHFDEMLSDLAAKGDGAPVSLLMMDIDRFKLFNDTYGHPEGDRCLRAVAGAMRAAVEGESPVPARIGGEEMALILPGRTLAQAQILAERICACVEALAIPHAGNETNGAVVTLSIGCAERPCGADFVEPLIGEADQMLYEAKRTGRNRVSSRLILRKAQPLPAASSDHPQSEAVERFRAVKLANGRDELDTLAKGVADLLKMPVGFISLYDRNEVELVGRHNITLVTTSKDASFSRYAVQAQEPMVVADLSIDPRFAQNPFVTCDRGARFYAAAPLIDPRSGEVIGAVSVCHNRPHYLFGAEERAILTTFARLAMQGME